MFGNRVKIGVGDLILEKEEKKLLWDVIESNRLSYGPKSIEFEVEFAQVHGCKYGVFCNSGTSALHIALAALKEKYDWSDGDEVIVPTVTFIATSNVIIHNNMKPVFVDVDSKTYNINPRLIEEKITSRARAIIPVHLFGLPADMVPIIEIAKHHNLRVIEDSCETMFAKYEGKSVGSFGNIGCFSTYIAHFLVTGVGGIATTNDPELAIILKSLMNHGRDSIYLKIDDDDLLTGKELFELVARRFKFVRLGHSFRATELEAAIGLGQLAKKDWLIKKRRENAKFYIDNLNDLTDFIQLPYIPSNREHNFMMFPIVLKRGDKRDLVNYLEENQIETRDMMPLINQPVYIKLFSLLEDDYPIAKWINQNGFYIGCHQYLKGEELEYVVDKIHTYFRLR